MSVRFSDFLRAPAPHVSNEFSIEKVLRYARVIAGAKHEILQEDDRYRAELRAAFDAFSPGIGAGRFPAIAPFVRGRDIELGRSPSPP